MIPRLHLARQMVSKSCIPAVGAHSIYYTIVSMLNVLAHQHFCVAISLS